MTLTAETSSQATSIKPDSPWQELTHRLNDPVHGQGEFLRINEQLQTLQTKLRAQSEIGLSNDAYAQHQAARQAVDAALNILQKIAPALSASPSGMATGPAQSPDFFKR
jgi:hypothetical protein